MITWGTLLIFLGGMAFLAAIQFLLPKTKGQSIGKKIAIWVLFVITALDLAVGISFVYINSGVGHVVATSTAIFVFIGSAVVLAVILARVAGLIGGKSKEAKEVA